MNERGIVGVATAASLGHAVWAAGSGVPTPAEAVVYAAALEAANAWGHGDTAALVRIATDLTLPAGVSLWSGLWLALLGKTSTVAVASLAPFHALAASGLWHGGKVAGGRLGGAFALVAGLGAAGALAYGAETLAAFPLFACVAYAGGAALDRAWGRAAAGGIAAALFAASGTFAGTGTLLDVAGPALLVGVVAALLLRGNAVTLGLLGAAAAALGVTYALEVDPMLVVPLLALTGASVGLSRAAVAGLGALAVAQIVGFHTDRAGWPGRPAALRPVARDGVAGDGVAGAPYALDPVLDWLVARIPAESARVALAVTEAPTLHAGLFVVRALERGDALTFTVVDATHPLDAMTDLGVVVTRVGTPSPRDGWRAQLPDPTETLSWPDGLRVDLWDRGLPPETLLGSPEEAEARNHPFRQSLWAYVDGAEVGPLLSNASSAEVVLTASGREALFVRNQAIWRAQAGLGTRFEAERPLLDAEGRELHAFDPTVVTLPDGTVRLYAAELVGTERGLDPAHHPTRVVSWRGPSLDALTREPGVRLEGVGIVDPAVIRDAGGWRMYVTVERRRVAMARSEDGLTFGALAHVADGTVPAPTPFGLVVQRQVMGWSVLYTVPDPATPAASTGSLELCATGASFADRLYYTRADEPCPEPVVLPSRRKTALDPLLRLAEN